MNEKNLAAIRAAALAQDAALQEAADAREKEWVCLVMPEGTNPRNDGRWDNP